MKDPLIEINNNLPAINSRVDEAKNKSVIWVVRKQKTTNQNSKKKKESKTMKTHKEPVGQPQAHQDLHHEHTGRRGERTRNWKPILKK